MSVSTAPGGPGYVADPGEVQLNTSRLSHHSTDSTGSAITLGGKDYYVGSRIGKSGAFVIGDPTQFDPNQSYTSAHTSQTGTSQKGLVHATPIEEKGYNFEEWNWPAVRLSCLVMYIGVMIALLAAVIGLCIEHRLSCESPFEWYQGSVIYHIKAPYFSDSNQDDIGDFTGMIDKLDYLEFLQTKTILVSEYLASDEPSWDAVSSFTDVDARLGDVNQLTNFITMAHQKESQMKVILEMSLIYTSNNHAWFYDSTQHRDSYNSPHQDFYIWKNWADSSIGTSWYRNIDRDMYYLNYNSSSKPVLNWGSTQLQQAFVGVLDFWLSRGVDGFVIRDLNKVYGASSTDFHNMIHAWRNKLDEFNTPYEKKILVVESDFLDTTSQSDRDNIIESIDLVIANVAMGINDTYSLQEAVRRGVRYSNKIPGPWTCWEVTGLRGVDNRYVASVHMYTLMLPGTPMLTAGQEVGNYYTKETFNPISPPKPMLWKSDNIYPYHPGMPLNETTIKALKTLISERNTAHALRNDGIYDEETRTQKDWNYRFRTVNKDWMAIERKFKRKKAYYYAGNYNNIDMMIDLSFISGYGNVVTDTSSRYKGSINLMEVNLMRGQGIVFSIAQ